MPRRSQKVAKDVFYTVEKILQDRQTANGVEFLLKWEGYGDAYNSWEPKENLHCDELLRVSFFYYFFHPVYE